MRLKDEGMTPGRSKWIMKCMEFEKKTPKEKRFLRICEDRMKEKGEMPEDMEEPLEAIFKRKGDTGSPITPPLLKRMEQ